jgi:hypothetical protein
MSIKVEQYNYYPIEHETRAIACVPCGDTVKILEIPLKHIKGGPIHFRDVHIFLLNGSPALVCQYGVNSKENILIPQQETLHPVYVLVTTKKPEISILNTLKKKLSCLQKVDKKRQSIFFQKEEKKRLQIDTSEIVKSDDFTLHHTSHVLWRDNTSSFKRIYTVPSDTVTFGKPLSYHLQGILKKGLHFVTSQDSIVQIVKLNKKSVRTNDGLTYKFNELCQVFLPPMEYWIPNDSLYSG